MGKNDGKLLFFYSLATFPPLKTPKNFGFFLQLTSCYYQKKWSISMSFICSFFLSKSGNLELIL